MSNSGRGAVAGALSLALFICFLPVRVQAEQKPDSRREARNPTVGISDQRVELAPDQLRDHWVTRVQSDEGETYQNLSLPEGFFGDNCEAFEGPVRYKGVPLDYASLGNVDTVLQRNADPVRLRDPVGSAGTVDLTLTELSLVSIEPITVLCDDGAQTFDVHVGLSPESAPTGWLRATKTHSNGGTFDSLIILYPLLTFTNVENTEDVYVLDTADTLAPVELTGRRIPFVHDPGDGVRSAYHGRRVETEIIGNPTRQFYPGFGHPADDRADGKQRTGDGVRLPGRISWVDPPLPPPPRGALHQSNDHVHCVLLPVGTCCIIDTNECQILSRPECIAAHGDYGGDGTDCESEPCCTYGKGSAVFSYPELVASEGRGEESLDFNTSVNLRPPPGNDPWREPVPGPPVTVGDLRAIASSDHDLVIDYTVRTLVRDSDQDHILDKTRPVERTFVDPRGETQTALFYHTATTKFSHIQSGALVGLHWKRDVQGIDEVQYEYATDGTHSLLLRVYDAKPASASITRHKSWLTEARGPERWLNTPRFLKLADTGSRSLVSYKEGVTRAGVLGDLFVWTDVADMQVELHATRAVGGQVRCAEWRRGGETTFRIENLVFAQVGSQWIPIRSVVEMPGRVVKEIEVTSALRVSDVEPELIVPRLVDDTFIRDEVLGVFYKYREAYEASDVVGPALGPLELRGVFFDPAEAVACPE